MSVLESIFSDLNVTQAIRSINRKGNPGIDGISMQQSIDHFMREKNALFESLQNGSYAPAPAKRIYIQNGLKQRPIDLLTGRDRILQRMVAQVLSIQFDQMFSNSSHGFRPDRGRQTAARQILDQLDQGAEYVLQLDISRYFQNVDRDHLLNLLSVRVKDQSVIQFIKSCISAGYYENDLLYTPDKGIPQGSPLSPILSNIYLDELDQELDSRKIPFIRYADDVAVITKTRQQAEVVFRYLQKWLPERLGLPLSLEKTKIVTASECRILGYNFMQTEDKKWVCDPPLPVADQERNNGQKDSIINYSHKADKIIHLKEDEALRGIKDVVLSDELNRWMPKPEADRIKNAVHNKISIMELAQAMGFTVVRHTADTVTLAEHDSCIIWPDTNKFKRFSATDKNGRTIGGTPFDFYLHFSGATYMQALNVFKNRVSGSQEKDNPVLERVARTDMTPMERDMKLREEISKRNSGEGQMKRVFAYLIQTRMIDPAIVKEQADRHCLQQITDDKGRTHCLFIGYDDNGLINAACFRSTSSQYKFMGDLPGCDYARGWFFDPQWNPVKQDSNPDPEKPLLCFESYIEMMSYMSILKEKGFDHQNFSYLACGSISKNRCIDQICEQYGYKHVRVMFNNDKEQEIDKGENPGRDAAEKTAARLSKLGIEATALVPSNHNDWNDMLKDMKSKTLKNEKKRIDEHEIGR